MAIKAPEFIQEAESSWEVTAEAVETPEFTVQKGDILVAYCIMENSSGGASEELNCSGGGFTWTKRQGSNTASNCMVYVYTAEATEAKSFKVKSEKKNSNAGYHHGVNCLTFRKSKGIGASSVTHTTGAPSLSITTEKEHSAVVMANADWEAKNGSTREYRTGAGTFTEKTYNFNSAQMTAYGGYYADASAAGAKTVGLAKPTGQKYTIAAVEVLGKEEEAAGKTEIELPIATETDSAQALNAFKQFTLPTATETDAAQTLAVFKEVALPVSTETDAAQAVTAFKSVELPISTEADEARALTAPLYLSLPIATETDSAQALALTKLLELAIATETDEAQSLALAKIAELPIATETDLARELETEGIEEEPAEGIQAFLSRLHKRILNL